MLLPVWLFMRLNFRVIFSLFHFDLIFIIKNNNN